jgi:LPS-assembly lipoprotein
MPRFQIALPSFSSPSPRWLRGFACVSICVILAACGFKLRGISPLPFDTLYTNVAENSAFGARLRRAVIASSPNTRFVSDATEAQAKLIQLSNHQSLRELSIDAQGQVEEYELDLEFIFQLTDSKGHLLLPPTTLRSVRELPYDPDIVQAKQGEIASLFLSMQQNLVDRIVRRLTAPDVEEAYRNSDALPVDENPTNTVPLAPDDNSNVPTPWTNMPSGLNGPF